MNLFDRHSWKYKFKKKKKKAWALQTKDFIGRQEIYKVTCILIVQILW